MGSVIGGWIGMTLFLKIYHIPIDYRMLISIILPNLLLGQMIGRWGNFYNQEVYGAIVSEDSLNWLIPSIKNHMFIDGAYREPLFLYESIINIIGWLIIGIIFKCVPFFKNNLKPGTHGALYLMWYGITRSSMELFRDEQFIMKIGNIPTSFILAILFVIVGLFLFIYLQFYYWSFQFYKTTILQNKKEYVLCVVKFNWKFILRKISYSNKEKYLAEMKEKMYKEILISRNRTKILYEQMKKEDFYILKEQK